MDKGFMPAMKLDPSACKRNDIVDFACRQLADDLKNRGIPGSRLPSVRELAKKHRISRQTMQKVYSRLEEDGLIVRLPGERTWRLAGKQEQLHCLGLVLPVPFSQYFQAISEFGIYRFRMYAGIVDRAAEMGFSTMPIQLPPPEASAAQIEDALLRIRQKCCGIIHLGDRGYVSDPPLDKLLDSKDFAQVSFNCIFTRKNIGAVMFDPFYAVSRFVAYMREYGHRRFVFVMPRMREQLPESVQYLLYEREEVTGLFKQAGVPEKDIFFFSFLRKQKNSFRRKIRELLKLKDPPTAFWCRNDETAIELIRMLQEDGFEVPRDFSVMGFNNFQVSEHSTPLLSTFNNPAYETGVALVDRLAFYLKNSVNNEVIYLPPVLVQRASVGPNNINPHYF